MMQRAPGFIAALVLCFEARAADDDHEHHHPTLPASDAPLTVTINPEARITVKRGGTLPTAAPCGTPAEVPVKIVNQALVSARLQAELVGSVPAGVILEFTAEPLKGVLDETRPLRITLTHLAPTDLTVVFRTERQIPNFGGTDRIHFLMRCQ